jgi:hypothetical protein
METPPASEELYIRIPASGAGFVYTIKHDAQIVRSAVVQVAAEAAAADDAYHGGSQAMD